MVPKRSWQSWLKMVEDGDGEWWPVMVNGHDGKLAVGPWCTSNQPIIWDAFPEVLMLFQLSLGLVGLPVLVRLGSLGGACGLRGLWCETDLRVQTRRLYATGDHDIIRYDGAWPLKNGTYHYSDLFVPPGPYPIIQYDVTYAQHIRSNVIDTELP